MAWLTQNWLWILLLGGGAFLMFRMHGMGGGCGGGHGSGHGTAHEAPPAEPPAGSDVAFDPVSGHALTTGKTAASTVFRGQAYYFETRENRDAFETDPDKYVAAMPTAGRALESAGASADRPRRRGGC